MAESHTLSSSRASRWKTAIDLRILVTDECLWTNLLADKRLAGNEIANNSHGTVAGHVVYQNGEVVLSMSGRLPHFNVRRELAVRTLKESGQIV